MFCPTHRAPLLHGVALTRERWISSGIISGLARSRQPGFVKTARRLWVELRASGQHLDAAAFRTGAPATVEFEHEGSRSGCDTRDAGAVSTWAVLVVWSLCQACRHLLPPAAAVQQNC